MRKMSVMLATLGLVVMGMLIPATSAQAASPWCDAGWKAAESGYFYAYRDINCSVRLGSDVDDDRSWADSSGSFQGSDNDEASSLLHKGTSGMAVKVYRHANYTGNYACITKAEKYVSNLIGDYLTGGSGTYRAWDSISSHKWVDQSACNGAFLQ